MNESLELLFFGSTRGECVTEDGDIVFMEFLFVALVLGVGLIQNLIAQAGEEAWSSKDRASNADGSLSTYTPGAASGSCSCITLQRL